MTAGVREILDTAAVFSIPMITRFRGVTSREGVLLRGPAGWAEFSPFRDYSDSDCVPWLRAALDSASRPWPPALRTVIDVNALVPVVDPDRAAELVRASGCRTVKVKVADPRADLTADVARVAAVRGALGPEGRIRVDANAAWSVPQAVSAVPALDDAAGGLEYVEQPCRTLRDLATVRERTGVPVAADETVRRAPDPAGVSLAGQVDVAVLKVAPLGGVWAAARVAQAVGVPCVVSSAVDTSVGLAAGLALAAALPELPFASGLDTGRLLAGDVASQRVRPVDGRIAVRGRAPDPDLLDAVGADPETRRWWLARLARVAALLGSAGRG